MKKILLICLLALLTSAISEAQTPVPAPEKEVVVVDLFARSRVVPAPYVEILRSYVLNAFVARGRHRVLEAQSVPELTTRIGGGDIVTPETAPAEMEAFLAGRAPAAAAAGARYLVSGTITDYKFGHVDLPAADSKKPPRPGFRASFRIVLSAVDLKLGVRLPDEPYELSATAPIAEDADRAALKRIVGQLEYYIDRNFKFETRILELCAPDKKNRFRELYIHSGTQMGVKTGDLFMVYEEMPVGDALIRQKIGRLRVTDVSNPGVALCKVAKGDAQIADAFLGNRTLICVSDGKAFGF